MRRSTVEELAEYDGTDGQPLTMLTARDIGIHPVVLTVGYLLLFLGLIGLLPAPSAFLGFRPWYLPTAISFTLLLVFGVRYTPVVILAVIGAIYASESNISQMV